MQATPSFIFTSSTSNPTVLCRLALSFSTGSAAVLSSASAPVNGAKARGSARSRSAAFLNVCVVSIPVTYP
jgi:hypothetical protein